MKGILVTGSSGTIGTRLCERLLAEGYGVIGVDRRPNPWSGQIDSLTVIGDLRDKKTLEEFLQGPFDLVVHLAANARVYNLVVDPSLAFDNMQSTFQVLEFCRRSRIGHLIFASSREVYGNTGAVRRSEGQSQVSSCESPYTASKVCGEALVHAYHRCYDIRSVVLRFSNVYGMYDASDRLVPLFIRLARQNQDLVVYGPDKVLDFTYIDDTVAGICGCIRQFDRVAGKTLNIASGQGSRIMDVAERIKEEMGSASRIALRENRTGEVVQFVADISAARVCLGYEPQTGIQEGIRKAIAWYSGLDPIAVSQVQRQRSSSLRTCGHGESVRTALRKDAV